MPGLHPSRPRPWHTSPRAFGVAFGGTAFRERASAAFSSSPFRVSCPEVLFRRVPQLNNSTILAVFFFARRRRVVVPSSSPVPVARGRPPLACVDHVASWATACPRTPPDIESATASSARPSPAHLQQCRVPIPRLQCSVTCCGRDAALEGGERGDAPTRVQRPFPPGYLPLRARRRFAALSC